MQDNMPSQLQEPICINVDKVFDWIVKEASFEFSPTGPISFPGVTATTDLVNAVVTCSVVPSATSPVKILHRENRQFTIDSATVCLQNLTIQKTFTLTLVVTALNGQRFTSLPITVSRCEQVTLCAPQGTDVEILFTDLDCFVCSVGTPQAGTNTITFTDLHVTISVCQSIQSTFPVTVEFLATFCEPRAELPFACPGVVRPAQCPAVFPPHG
ncbi:hypothetical protein [Lysinibacillus sp. G4S2]|uniref:hypothetical protein n=1 Tax=Lysinibacillus sp. G4S2 TaxID=3055859 RepID=UPI0025A0BF6E|nr:hypothetical protein [Lysinibacillus sp. G4S2]MDM5250694.1 hypothetical protein [Lysinibacillus sp. G4S2]